MSDRVYPASTPTPTVEVKPLNPPPGSASANTFPSTKPNPYARPRLHLPPASPPRRHRRRSCCCSCILWTFLTLLTLILLAAIAGGIFYAIYRPRHPTFTVTNLRLSSFNVTSNQLTSSLDLAVSTRNPSKQLAYIYSPTTISVSSNGVAIGDGSFPAFVHEAGNTTVLSTVVSGNGNSLDAAEGADMKTKTSLPLEVQLETNVGFMAGGWKSSKVNVRVICDGIDVRVPNGRTPPTAVSPAATCTTKFRVKIWKWYA